MNVQEKVQLNIPTSNVTKTMFKDECGFYCLLGIICV